MWNYHNRVNNLLQDKQEMPTLLYIAVEVHNYPVSTDQINRLHSMLPGLKSPFTQDKLFPYRTQEKRLKKI